MHTSWTPLVQILEILLMEKKPVSQVVIQRRLGMRSNKSATYRLAQLYRIGYIQGFQTGLRDDQIRITESGQRFMDQWYVLEREIVRLRPSVERHQLLLAEQDSLAQQLREKGGFL